VPTAWYCLHGALRATTLSTTSSRWVGAGIEEQNCKRRRRQRMFCRVICRSASSPAHSCLMTQLLGDERHPYSCRSMLRHALNGETAMLSVRAALCPVV
jgi:hypothetical protein